MVSYQVGNYSNCLEYFEYQSIEGYMVDQPRYNKFTRWKDTFGEKNPEDFMLADDHRKKKEWIKR